ncbi:MAG TPA: D-alanyl-D-alanine carboxypeptidase, partial [Firmicutes bacterium]|nr:D-alanyl-D-alanine carboxypeptidase [Bacillota bacterium]
DNRQEVGQKIFLDNSIVAPVKAGAKIGELAFYAGDSELGRVDLVAQNGIERKVTSRWWLYLIPALGLMILVL